MNVSGATTTARVADLTIADGLATGDTFATDIGPLTAGGGLNNQSHLTLAGVVMNNNQITGGLFEAGGAIANVFGASLTVLDCAFQGNGLSGGTSMAGGAIYCDVGASADVEGSQFDGNAVSGGFSFGGAISSNASALMISGCTFNDNRAQGSGGGVGFGGAVDVEPFGYFVCGVSDVVIDGCDFTGNQALGGAGVAGGAGGLSIGGAVDVATSGGAAIISHCNFSDNLSRGGKAGNGGTDGTGIGGVYNDAVLTLILTSVSGNKADVMRDVFGEPEWPWRAAGSTG